MDYSEAKTKMEFGLTMLGSGDRGYTLVTEQEWIDTSEACESRPHLLDMPSKVCIICKVFFIMDDKLEQVTDDELVFGIHSLQDFIRNGVMRTTQEQKQFNNGE